MSRPITCLLCLAGAFCLFLAYPPFDWGGFAWIAFVPLWIALEDKAVGERTLLGFLTGLLFFLSSLFWLRYVTWLGMFLLSIYLAVYLALFSVWSGFCLRRFPIFLQGLLLAAGWVALEQIRSHLFTGFGWNLLGYSQWHRLSLIQIADVTGAYGVSFLVIIGNVGLFFCWKALREKEARYLWPLPLALCLVFSTSLYGTLSLRQTVPSHPVRIGIVQGNIPQDLKWNPSVREMIFTKYERLTERVSLNQPDIVFWPETSVPGILPEERDLLDRLRHLTKKGGDFLLVGSAYRLEEGMTNSALLITPKGEITQRYDKLHLVPYGEYIPFEKQFPMLRDRIVTGDFIAGKELTVFGHPAGRFSVLICFEDIFPDLARRFVGEGAQMLVNITNDAWFHKSAAPLQHAQASVFRAVENHVPVVRAANTGLSCVIDANGRILGTVSDERGEEIEVTGSKFFILPLAADHPPTFYTRHGDLFAGGCVSMAILALALRVVRARRGRA